MTVLPSVILIKSSEDFFGEDSVGNGIDKGNAKEFVCVMIGTDVEVVVVDIEVDVVVDVEVDVEVEVEVVVADDKMVDGVVDVKFNADDDDDDDNTATTFTIADDGVKVKLEVETGASSSRQERIDMMT